MFKLMRNTHLALALVVVFMAAIYAVSSVVMIYRPVLPASPPEDQTSTVTVPPPEAATPRALALYLMRTEGLRGDLSQVTADGDGIGLLVARPGTQARVQYSYQTGEARIQLRSFSFRETLVQLHHIHGFWHEFFPSNVWALLALAASIGLFLLGASGLYLWFKLYNERKVGAILLVAGLMYGFGTLLLTRMG